MKTIIVFVLAAMISTSADEASDFQQKFKDAVEEIEAKYPDAQNADSEFSKEMDLRVGYARKKNDPRLANPRWLIVLADEVARSLTAMGTPVAENRKPTEPSQAEANLKKASDARKEKEQMMSELRDQAERHGSSNDEADPVPIGAGTQAANQDQPKQVPSDYRTTIVANRAMTHGDYQKFLAALSNDRTNDPVMFIVRSKNDIVTHLASAGLDLSESKDIFKTNADYNEAVLASLLAIEKGFPILEHTMSSLTKWTAMIRCANDSEKALVREIYVNVVNDDTTLKKRVGLPHSGDVELRDIKLDTDVEILKQYSNLDPKAIFGGKKWPGVRPVFNREKRWADIESDPKTVTLAGVNVMLDILGMKGNKAGEAVFSDPYFTAEAMHMLSTVGNGFSIDRDEFKEFRRRCDLAAARTKSLEEYQFLTAFYALLLRGDEEAKKSDK